MGLVRAVIPSALIIQRCAIEPVDEQVIDEGIRLVSLFPCPPQEWTNVGPRQPRRETYHPETSMSDHHHGTNRKQVSLAWYGRDHAASSADLNSAEY